MKLTSKGRYAVTAMLDVALNSKNKPVSLAEISERQEISLSYLEQLFARLRRHSLVASIRGPGGGYVLNKNLDQITISAIIKAVNESVDVTKCHGQGCCQRGKRCLTHSLWYDLSQRIDSFLTGIALSELVNNKDVKAVFDRQHANADKTNLG